jgi:hypothetical protein
MFAKGPNIRKLEIPANLDTNLAKSLVDKEFKVFMFKFILALLALIADSTIKFAFQGATLELNKAYPGISLAFISLLLMLFSRLNIKFN